MGQRMGFPKKSGSSSGVTSFNTRTGAVTLQAADVEATFLAKGGILLGTGPGSGTELDPGANGTVLTADSTQAAGVKWAAPSSSGISTVTSPENTLNPIVSGTSLTIDDARESLLRPSGVMAESIPRWLCRDDIPCNPVGADGGYNQATAVPIVLTGGQVISYVCFLLGTTMTNNSNHCYCFLFNTSAQTINYAVATTTDLGSFLQTATAGEAVEIPIAQIVSGPSTTYTVPGTGSQLYYAVIYPKDNTGTTLTLAGLQNDVLAYDLRQPMLALASAVGYGAPPNISSGTYNHGFGDSLPLIPNFDTAGGGFGGGLPYVYVK